MNIPTIVEAEKPAKSRPSAHGEGTTFTARLPREKGRENLAFDELGDEEPHTVRRGESLSGATASVANTSDRDPSALASAHHDLLTGTYSGAGLTLSTDGAGALPKQVTDNVAQTLQMLKTSTGLDLEARRERVHDGCARAPESGRYMHVGKPQRARA